MGPRRIVSRRERARHILRGLLREAAFASQFVVLFDQFGESFLGDPLDVRIDEEDVAPTFVVAGVHRFGHVLYRIYSYDAPQEQDYEEERQFPAAA